MRLTPMLLAVAASLTAAGAASAASVEVKDAVVRVTVIPETRGDVKVEIIAPNPKLPLTVRSFGGRTIVDGGLNHKIRDCRGKGERTSVHVRGVGDVGWADMPQIVIRTPRDVDVDTGGAVWGTVGRSASLNLGNAGCGDWTVGNVEGRMRISQAGSGDTHAGTAGEAKVRVAGSGDTQIADVKGGLAVDIAGSGDVSVVSVSGPVDVHVAGSGGVRIAGGTATGFDVAVAGSGDVHFGGTATNLKARIMGSGDVHVREVTGHISKTVMGSGGVSVGN
ncbi:GIN domain-containing protein [Phenylobacterium sp.]|uniref:GIN domain-containing protein n=1 Tax=Phenylobacterium sp. TaxID=1871053 RepID=UPI00286BE989|nr:DUF2807 domain-containing protein [Phenylobacterium sp.]